MNFQFPAIGDATIFELFCQDFFKLYRDAADSQRYGLSGHKQNGVDILLTMKAPQTSLEGVQCKKKNYYRGKLKSDAIDKIISDAKSFTPSISHLHIASVSKRDPSHQSKVAQIHSPFKVTVHSWDDFNDQLLKYPTLIPKYFDRFVIKENFSNPEFVDGEIARVLKNYDDLNSQIVEAVSDSEIRKNFSSKLATAVQRLLIEICKNAIKPGRATQIDLTISSLEINLEYDGKNYSPYELLREKLGQGGKRELEYFLQTFMSDLHLTHSFDNGKNSITITFPGEIKKIGSTLPLSLMLSRRETTNPTNINKIISKNPHAKKIFIFLTDEAAVDSDFKPYLSNIQPVLVKNQVELCIFAFEGNEDFLEDVKKSNSINISYTILKRFC